MIDPAGQMRKCTYREIDPPSEFMVLQHALSVSQWEGEVSDGAALWHTSATTKHKELHIDGVTIVCTQGYLIDDTRTPKDH